MKKIILIAVITFMLASFGYSQNKAEAITGLWYTEEKDSKIEVYKKGDSYFGKIVWLSDSVGPNNDIRRDVNNENEELQRRPLLGLTIVQELEWDAAEEEWNNGEIYDPRSGNTYSAYAKLEEPNKLKLRGYLGFSLLGRTTYWTRAR